MRTVLTGPPSAFQPPWGAVRLSDQRYLSVRVTQMDDPATEAGQHSWGHELGRQVGERSQDEPALPHPWMGHDRIRLVDRLVPDQERSASRVRGPNRTVRTRPASASSSRHRSSSSHAAGGVHLDHHVQEWALLRTPDGLGLVHRRHCRQLADGAQALDSFPQKPPRRSPRLEPRPMNARRGVAVASVTAPQASAGPARRRRIVTPADARWWGTGGRSLRTVTTTSSSRSSRARTDRATAPARASSKSKGGPLTIAASRADQIPVVHGVGQLVGNRRRTQVERGVEVDLERLSPSPFFWQEPVNPHDAQTSNLDPLVAALHPIAARGGNPSTATTSSRPTGPIWWPTRCSTSTMDCGGDGRRPDHTRNPATAPITQSPKPSWCTSRRVPVATDSSSSR